MSFDDSTTYQGDPIFKGKAAWHAEKDDDLAGAAMAALADELWTMDEPRRTDIEKNLRRFGGKTLRGVFAGRELLFDRDNVRLNVTKAVTETLTAKIGTNRPRPKVLTDGANHSLRIRAKKLQRFLDGTYQAAEVYVKIPQFFRDALLMGTGVMHFYADVGARRTCLERVFPLEMLVDPVEAVNGEPRQIFRQKFLDKDVLKRMFPKKANAIERAKSVDLRDLPDFWNDGRATRMVRVVEGWYLADHDYDGNLVPGRHALVVGNETIYVEDYEETTFPFEFFHWTPPVRGFWGDSAVQEIRGIEKEINRLLQHIQKSMRLAGMPWLLVPNEAKVKTDKLTNEVGQIVRFDGPTPPTVASFQAVHPQVMEHLWALYAKAFETLGTNQMQAAAIKPPGIDSGRALEQLGEEHLVRFKTVSKNFEDLVGRRFASQFVRAARELDEELKARNVSEGYVLRALDNKTALKISWQDCAIAQDDFFLQTWPTSVLPITPSGRTEEVERWQQNQWITPQRAQDLLEFPDLESESNLTKADSELLEWQLEQMLDDGKDIFPEPRQDLQTALQRGTYALEYGLRNGTPEENLDKLRVFLNACDELTQQAAANAAPSPAMDAASMAQAQMQPPGMPMPAGAMGPMSPQGMPGLPPVAPPGAAALQ
jgi:hypothetical protein